MRAKSANRKQRQGATGFEPHTRNFLRISLTTPNTTHHATQPTTQLYNPPRNTRKFLVWINPTSRCELDLPTSPLSYPNLPSTLVHSAPGVGIKIFVALNATLERTRGPKGQRDKLEQSSPEGTYHSTPRFQRWLCHDQQLSTLRD